MASHLSARYVFRSGGLPDDALAVVDFVGDEAISQPFRFVVNLVSADPDLTFESVVNEKASLLMARGDEVAPVHGIVTDFQQGRRVQTTLGDRFLYRAVLVPRLHRLTFSHQSRIFQHLTVEEIVTKVLGEGGLSGADVRFMLQGSYAPREYCTQYKESDLQFVQRLLEYEGIRYFFEHGDSRETLVVTDDPEATPSIAGDGAALHYHVGGGLAAAETAETVREFVTHQQIVTGRVVLKDYNYRTPGSPIQTESQLNGDMPGVFYDYGVHVKDAAEAQRLAKVRNEEIEGQRELMRGESDCLRLRAGARFTLASHYRDAMNQSYVLTAVHHEGRQPDASPFIGETDLPEYTNGFTCVPATAPYRPPRRTPEPKLPGVMTALVESGGGDYAFLDDQGRYRLKMPFDLSDATDGAASKAVRLAQPYTGPGYGQHFPVHKGAEMVFACVDGHVDRPLGLATVPNPSQASPVTSANAPQNVVRTWGRNEFTLDDTKGAENVYLFGTKDHTVEITNNEEVQIGNDRTQRVGHDEALRVGHDQTADVKNDQTLTVGNDQTIEVGANRSMAVAANLDETVGAAMTLSVGASVSVTVGASMDESVAVAKSETIGAAYMLSVGAAKSETVGGVSSETVGAAKSVEVAGILSESAGASYSLDAGTDGTLSFGKRLSVKSGADAVVDAGGNVTVKAGKKAVIEAADELTLKCGSATIVLKKGGDITIKGAKIDVSGSGNVTIKGSKIAAN